MRLMAGSLGDDAAPAAEPEVASSQPDGDVSADDIMLDIKEAPAHGNESAAAPEFADGAAALISGAAAAGAAGGAAEHAAGPGGRAGAAVSSLASGHRPTWGLPAHPFAAAGAAAARGPEHSVAASLGANVGATGKEVAVGAAPGHGSFAPGAAGGGRGSIGSVGGVGDLIKGSGTWGAVDASPAKRGAKAASTQLQAPSKWGTARNPFPAAGQPSAAAAGKLLLGPDAAGGPSEGAATGPAEGGPDVGWGPQRHGMQQQQHGGIGEEEVGPAGFPAAESGNGGAHGCQREGGQHRPDVAVASLTGLSSGEKWQAAPSGPSPTSGAPQIRAAAAARAPAPLPLVLEVAVSTPLAAQARLTAAACWRLLVFHWQLPEAARKLAHVYFQGAGDLADFLSVGADGMLAGGRVPAVAAAQAALEVAVAASSCAGDGFAQSLCLEVGSGWGFWGQWW